MDHRLRSMRTEFNSITVAPRATNEFHVHRVHTPFVLRFD